MYLSDNLNILTLGLISVIISTEAYKKDDTFMDIWDGENLEQALQNYLGMEKYCMFVKRKNLFYRTDEECNDIFSQSFIDAFFRDSNYPVRSYKGYTLSRGTATPVRLSKFLKDSLFSKVKTINTALQEEKSKEVNEHRISSSEGEDFGFADFLESQGIESTFVDLSSGSEELKECDRVISELSDKIFPQVSYSMLLRDLEITKEDFQTVIKYQMNLQDIPEYMVSRYEVLVDVIGRIMLNNQELLKTMFGHNRLQMIQRA